MIRTLECLHHLVSEAIEEERKNCHLFPFFNRFVKVQSSILDWYNVVLCYLAIFDIRACAHSFVIFLNLFYVLRTQSCS